VPEIQPPKMNHRMFSSSRMGPPSVEAA
jgi:hypothetical protein